MNTSPWLEGKVRETDFPRRICGRIFSLEDLQLIRRIIAENRSASRSRIARMVCSALQWYKPDGGLKTMSCSVVLLRLHQGSLIELPPTRRVPRTLPWGNREIPDADAQGVVSEPVKNLMPIELRRVKGATQESYLWNELIARYHYLGYSRLPGAQIRYLVYSCVGLVGAVGFSAAAWKAGCRDDFLGWSSATRQENLQLIVNNSRFLILPWVKSKNLASKILYSA